jgi:hypothetical protein
MENTIEINGRLYTRDEVERAANIIKTAYRRFVEVVQTVWRSVLSCIHTVARRWNDYVKQDGQPIGYKRLLKMDQIKSYEEMSVGKSNNWRKVHGLSLIRMGGNE